MTLGMTGVVDSPYPAGKNRGDDRSRRMERKKTKGPGISALAGSRRGCYKYRQIEDAQARQDMRHGKKSSHLAAEAVPSLVHGISPARPVSDSLLGHEPCPREVLRSRGQVSQLHHRTTAP